MANLNELKPVGKLNPFAKFCCTIGNLPTSYMISLTYEEQLLWLCKYLEDTVIPAVNNNAEAVQELQELYVVLKNYVDHYFDNLDVQEEINNKLDEMAEQGTLQEIITDYLDTQAIFCYDTVNDMKQATNLRNGSYAKTLGYYEVNDGGAGLYKIVDNNTLIDDGGSIHDLDNGMKAELIVNDFINVKQFGAKGDNTTDDTLCFKKSIQYIRNNIIENLYIPSGEYIISEELDIPSINIIGENKNNTIFKIVDFNREHCFRNDNFWNTNNDLFETIVMKNLQFVFTKITTTLATMVGIAYCKNCVFDNLIFKCDVETNFSTIDLYSNNENIYESNIYCKLTNGGTRNRSCISVREFSPTGVTNNIHFDNIYAEKDGADELVWIDAWKGKLTNVFINNCTCINTSEQAENVVWISGNGANSYLKNVFITNSYFYKNNVSYHMFSIGKSQSNVTDLYVNNIKIDNCVIECGNVKTTSCRIIDVGKYVKENGVIITNSIIKSYNTEQKFESFIISENSDNNVISMNNHFYSGNCRYAFQKISKSINDYFEGSADIVYRHCKFIKDAITKNPTGVFADTYQNTITNYTISDSDIECTALFSSSGDTVNTTVNIRNCNVKSNDYILAAWNPQQEKTKIILNNVNLTTNKIINSTGADLYCNNLTVNGLLYGNIPSNPNTRQCFAIGTTFLSTTPNKTVVRKISEGSDVSNWQEL